MVDKQDIIGVDVGTERVGFASLAAGSPVPTPLSVQPRAGRKAERYLIDILTSQGVTALVVGLPLDASGTETDQCEDVRSFLARVTKRLSVEIIFVDEWGSSEEARELLGKKATSDRSLALDAYAACVLITRHLSGNYKIADKK